MLFCPSQSLEPHSFYTDISTCVFVPTKIVGVLEMIIYLRRKGWHPEKNSVLVGRVG